MIVRVPRPQSAPTQWAAIAILIAATSPAALADGPRGAEWASKDAAIYVEAPRPSALLGRLLDDKLQGYLRSIPAYGRYLKGDQFRQHKAGVEFVAHLLETEPAEGLGKLTGGGIVLAVEVEPGKPPWGFLAVTPGDPAFLARSHEKLLGLARADATGKGLPDPIKEMKHEGVTIYSTGKDEAHAIARDTLLIAQSAEALKAVLSRAKGPFASIKDNPEWRARSARASADTMAWGFVRLDKLRAADPKRFTVPETTEPGPTFLVGDWIEAVRKAPWVAAEVGWSDGRLSAEVALPTPPGGYPDALKKFLPTAVEAAPTPLRPRGVLASAGLWRDLSAIWDVRNDLFAPQVVQGLAQLDTVAGQYFGGRDFGSGVLGSIGSRWRFVVAEQDWKGMRPVPERKLPAFALVIDLKPDDDEFAQRLKVAFQSFVGLANIGAAQTKAPPLELVSETVDGLTVSSTRFMLPKGDADAAGPVHQRHNYTPTVVQVGNHFVLSSSLGLAKDLIPVLKAPETQADSTLLVEADGAAMARVLDANRRRIVADNMLKKGTDKAGAEGEVDLLLGLLRYAGRGTLTARDGDKAVVFRADFALGAK